MAAPQLINITCSRCSRPLFAFEQKKPGEVLIRSFGAAMRPTASGPFIALCPCGGQEPIPRELVPGHDRLN